MDVKKEYCDHCDFTLPKSDDDDESSQEYDGDGFDKCNYKDCDNLICPRCYNSPYGYDSECHCSEEACVGGDVECYCSQHVILSDEGYLICVYCMARKWIDDLNEYKFYPNEGKNWQTKIMEDFNLNKETFEDLVEYAIDDFIELDSNYKLVKKSDCVFGVSAWVDDEELHSKGEKSNINIEDDEEYYIKKVYEIFTDHL